MPYQTSPSKVTEYSSLLDTLALRCIKEKEAHEIRVSDPERKPRLVWQIHELLASAQEYPRNEYDEVLRDSVTVRQTTGDAHVITIEPKTRAALKESADLAPEAVKGYEKVVREYWNKREEAIVSWAVQEDAQSEHNRFREALKGKYKIEFLETEEVGERHLRRYALEPRPQQKLSKEEYYKKERPSPTDPPEKRRKVIEKYVQMHEEEMDED